MLRIAVECGQDSSQCREEICFTFNGHKLKGFAGEPIAAALLANGIRTLRHHDQTGNPRGVYCGIGHCYECRVTVDGVPGVRACLTPLHEGMVVSSGWPQRKAEADEK